MQQLVLRRYLYDGCAEHFTDRRIYEYFVFREHAVILGAVKCCLNIEYCSVA